MPPSPVPTAVALLLWVAACGGAPAPEGGAPASLATRDTMTASSADSLEIAFIAPTEARGGAHIGFVLTVRNRSARPVDLYLHGREPTMDVVVAHPDGEVVWRRLAEAVVPAALALRTLAPGEQLEVRATWDQRLAGGGPVAPGTYVVHAELLREGAPLRSPARPLRLRER